MWIVYNYTLSTEKIHNDKSYYEFCNILNIIIHHKDIYIHLHSSSSMCQTSYFIYRQFLPTWIHRSFVITSKHFAGFTAQRIIETYCSNARLVRIESNVFGKNQVIITFKEYLHVGARTSVLWEERDCSIEIGESYRLFDGNTGVETIRKPARVKERYELEGSDGPDFGEPDNRLLASVSTYLLNVYLDSALNVGAVRDSSIGRY